MTIVAEELLKHMRNFAQFRSIHTKSDHKFSCAEHFMLEYGQRFTASNKDIELGYPNHCFVNSYLAVRKQKDFIYCEGMILSEKLPMPIHHAWVLQDGEAVDLTLKYDSTREYFGVPFRRDFLMAFWKRKTGYSSLIDNWKEEYPLLKGIEPDLFLEKF